MIGHTISHYRIIEKLGEGGMGVVYKAEDTKLKRTVALKFLSPQAVGTADEKTRLIHEAQAASALNHPNVTTIYEINEHEGQLFIAMELVDGKTLKQVVIKELSSVKRVLDVAIQAGEGLAAAHEKGIIHRDIKSENIMVTAKGQAKVMDFGLAKVRGSTRLTQVGSTVGTASYMSPEQAQGEEVDHRSDIFSFGVVLYELLTGRLPFKGEHEAALMYSIINQEPPPVARFNERASDDLQRVVSKTLAKDCDERYQHVDDIVADLRRERRALESARTGHVKPSTVQPPATAAQTQTRAAEEAPAPRKPKQNSLKFIVPATIVGVAVIVIILFNPFNIQVSQKETVAADHKSVAVLPFTNMSGDQEDEFFSDGVTEDIIAQLSNIAELKVISRTSTMQYKNTTKNIRDIAEELNVATILEGSVRRADNQVRIVAQLIDASSDKHLWAQTYDKELTQIFAIQSDVARQIASALEAELSPREEVRLAKKPTVNIDAYTYYLKGREYYNLYSKQDNENAIELFKKALRLDPDYALAYAGLGDAYAQRADRYGFPSVWIDSSIVVSEKAIALDPTLAEGYKALGLGYQYKGWLKRSLETYHKAVELNPDYEPAIANIGWVNEFIGNSDEALRWHKRGLALSPMVAFGYLGPGVLYLNLGEYSKASEWINKALALQPDLGMAHTFLAWLFLAQDENQECIEQCEQILLSDPNNIFALDLMGHAHVRLGDYPSAEECYARTIAIDSLHGNTTSLGYVYLKTGRLEHARKMFARSLERANEELAQGNEDCEVPYDLAVINALQGNKVEAYDRLQQAIDAGWRNYDRLERSPFLESLRGDERFETIVAGLKGKMEEMRRRVERAGKEEWR
jgi:TolB-like protein/Tfp pilus assembly protein PilF/tRNA A-37 threonylcarbamoyl transferase component Bud32